MTRLGSALNAAGALALLAVLAWAFAQHRNEDWRAHQHRYRELLASEGGEAAKQVLAAEAIRPHELFLPDLGFVDRCTTCHLGMEPGAVSIDGDETFKAHPGNLLESHPVGRFGCTSCHGGQGRALESAGAHDRRHSGGANAFTPPSVRCARCHPAGGLAGTGLVTKGVGLYFEHGCSGCHQPGRPGPGIGPSLASIGLRGGSYIRKAVLYPDLVYPQTIMPPMRYKLAEQGPEIDALVGYLRTLEPWPTNVERRERRFDSQSCTGCHRVGDATSSPTGPEHRCPHLHDEAQWLRCSNCHGERPRPARAPSEVPARGVAEGAVAAPSIPEQGDALVESFYQQLQEAARRVEVDNPTGRCPHIEEAMSACGVCHREGER